MTHLNRTIRLVGATGTIRTASFQQREHLVVPVTMLVEGVVWPFNAPAPELVLASEFSRAPQIWNGRPVVMDHPEMNGEKVSANHPEILEMYAFGHLFNTFAEDNKLHSEAWLDPEKAKSVGPAAEAVIARAREKKAVEISVGAYMSLEETPGIYNGKKYAGIWRDLGSDHLAMLPEGTIGACSNAMGCGTSRAACAHLVTAEGLVPVHPTRDSEATPEIFMDETKKKSLKEKFMSLFTEFELFPADEPATPPAPAEETQLTAASGCGCKDKNKTSGDNQMNKDERIAALIAKGKATEQDKVFLQSASETVLKALEAEPEAAKVEAPAPAKTETKGEETKTETKVEEKPAVLAAAPAKLTREQFLASAPDDLREQFEEGLRIASERKVATIKGIKDTGRCNFSDVELNNMSQSMLNQLAKLAAVPEETVDFGVANLPRAAAADTKKVPAPPSLVTAIQADAAKK